MVEFYTIPNWFFGYDIAFEVLLGFLTLLVAAYSLAIYRVSEQREHKLFSISFLLISLSFFVWSLINIYFVKALNEQTRILLIEEISIFNVIAIYSHIILFLCGLITLFYVTTKSVNTKAYTLLLLSGAIGMLFAYNKALFLPAFSAIILAFILSYYIIEYKKNGNKRTLLTFIAFVLLFAANMQLILGEAPYINYVVVHILELIAFSLIVWSLIGVIKHGEKKKSP